MRITTRFDRNFLPMALFGSIHETGHALYEQGVAPRYDGNVLGDGASLGVHESQSRLWENLVGRSRPFWQRFYPDLQAAFPDALAGRRARTRSTGRSTGSSPSLIRVEADEVTYNLHILLRFEMEKDLLDGRLSVAGRARRLERQDAGVSGPDAARRRAGHPAGRPLVRRLIGYFPTYTLGNLLSVQLFEKANADLGGSLERRSRPASSRRCWAGCARTSTSGAASTCRPS